MEDRATDHFWEKTRSGGEGLNYRTGVMVKRTLRMQSLRV